MSNKNDADLTRSMEDYLEAVLLLGAPAGENVRVKAVADRLGVSKPNVVTSTKLLVERGYIAHEHYGFLKLTRRGLAAARDVYARHVLMHDFLARVLMVGEEAAQREACELEHCISSETQRRLGKFIEFMDLVSRQYGTVPWMDGFCEFLDTGAVRHCHRAGGDESEV